MKFKSLIKFASLGAMAFLMTSCGVNEIPTELPSSESTICQHPNLKENEIERKNPTCTSAGYIEYECDECHEQVKENIPIDEDAHKAIEADDSVCTEKTYQAKVSAECGQTYTVYGRCKYCDTIIAYGTERKEPHNYVEKKEFQVVDDDTHKLVQGKKCTICGQWDKLDGYYENEESHNMKGGTASNPILAAQNECCRYYECTCECGYDFVIQQKHSWDAGTMVKEETCATPRILEFKCTAKDCGISKYEEVKSYKAHTLDEGVLVSEPTCAEVGIKSYHCSTCNNDIIEEIPKTQLTITLSKDIEMSGLNGYIRVDNTTSLFEFDDYVSVPDGASWSIATDPEYTNILPSKYVSLSEGENTFYIVAKSNDNEKTRVCKIVVFRTIKYTISFDTKGGTSIKPITVEDNETIDSLESPEKVGYEFVGWYVDDEPVNLPYKPTANTVFVAKYYGNTYIVKINTNGGTLDVTNEYNVRVGEEFQFPKVTPPQDKVFRGYKYNDSLVVDYTGYVEEWSITSNAVIYAQFIGLNDTIEFGSYPQTRLADDEIVANLNTIAGELPDEFDTKKWTDYGFYENGYVSSYAYYIDVDYDEDGDYDYRGVYFTKYRAPKTNSAAPLESASNQYKNKYKTNNVYWFKYEAISWTVSTIESNSIKLVAKLILDCQAYNDTYNSSGIYEHRGDVGYSTDYRLSLLRQWLNDSFYTTAFNTIEKSKMVKSNITVGKDEYACPTVSDYVFYEGKTSRYNTDYCNALGGKIYGSGSNTCGYCWSTSICDGSRVNQYSATFNDSSVDNISGVIPVIYIKIS